MPRRHRLAIVCSHPIQYLAPWFVQLAQSPRLDVTVLYGSLEGQVQAAQDRDFGRALTWDVDLLSGYRYVELHSHANKPGLDRFWGVLSFDLVQHLRRDRFDAVLILGWNYALYPLALSTAVAHRLPVILRGDSVRYRDADENEATLRGLARLQLLSKQQILRRYVGLCAATLAVSTGNRRLLTHYGVPDDKIFSAPYAVDHARFRLPTVERDALRRTLRQQLGALGDRPVLLFCGKFSEVKAPQLLLSAYRRLRQSGIDASLWLCGDGALRDSLVQDVARGAIPDVQFLGFRNQRELPGLYAAADVLVVPSQREAFAMVVPEAMHAGLPVIASDRVGCVEDLVIPEQTGLVFPTGDEDSLLRCLSSLCAGESGKLRREKLGQAANQNMATWTYAETTQGLLAALDAIYIDRAQRKPWFG